MVFARFMSVLLLLLCAATPAQAFQTSAKSPSQVTALKSTGAAFLQIAKDFGCSEFTWAEFTDAQFRAMQLEYMPKGQDPKTWTRLQSTTVYGLTGREDADAEIMDNVANNLIDTFKKTADVVSMQPFKSGSGDPAFYIEYRIGKGDAREHNAGVFMRTSDRAAAFMQIQARKGNLTDKDKNTLLGYLGATPEQAAGKTKASAAKESPQKENEDKVGAAENTQALNTQILLPRRKPQAR